MWEKRKQDEFRPPSLPVNTATQTPAPVPVREQAVTPPPPPVKRAEPEPSRGGTAVIGKAMRIKGEIYSQEDLYIDGEIEGTLELKDHCLTIGPNGKARSSIKAREAVVMGLIHGNVEAKDKIAIRKDGKLVGDIKTAGIIIEDGAYFKGSIDIVKPEPGKAAAKPAAAAPAPAVSAAHAPAVAGAPADNRR
jgi:cytoskeletal protein CcmA (bactofilin family)